MRPQARQLTEQAGLQHEPGMQLAVRGAMPRGAVGNGINAPVAGQQPLVDPNTTYAIYSERAYGCADLRPVGSKKIKGEPMIEESVDCRPQRRVGKRNSACSSNLASAASRAATAVPTQDIT